eukprot:8404891-Ditylum_brightwellii.AAC.1
MADDFTLDGLSIAMDSIASYTIGSSAMISFSLSSIDMKNTEHKEQVQFVIQGTFYSMYCLKDPKRKKDSQSGHVAIKALHDLHDNGKYSSRLNNEFTISRQLSSQCSSVRNAISNAEIGGLPAIYLEWVHGTTLSEWIKSFHESVRSPQVSGDSRSTIINNNDKNIILQLAYEVSNALAEIHSAGVAHNNLNPSHIIVNGQSYNGNMTVTVISLGSSILMADVSGISSDIHKDLLSLGS